MEYLEKEPQLHYC